ncbi:lipase family protein [Nocardia sp. CDC160]|uniref:lipase family protein n=1 Tax=Nocardia sp. CDC160 TaxID=3112166 RepID=UPI002DB84316|nr:lipase family protein [Nocardia sp. CDC160]
MLRCLRNIAGALMIGCCAIIGFGAAPAFAQPPADISGQLPPAPPGFSLADIQRWLDELIPAPPLPPAPADSPLVDTVDLPAPLAALRSASMPAAIGDSFVDDWPDRLEGYDLGGVVAVRDVSATAALPLIVPVRQVLQLKYRTNDSHDAPSYGIATLVLPPGNWTGPGKRPVVVNNLPIDALGRDCNPSYTMAHGFSRAANFTGYILPTTQLALLRGYAVLITDHEGPRMAYADPLVAGHLVLDAIRAVRYQLPDELRDSRFGMIGYSGGAIATNGAVKLMSEYAPELSDVVVGAAMGGVPADFSLLAHSMNANLASGVFLGAVFGIGRERPEILARMNHAAQWAAVSKLNSQCGEVFAIPGLLQLPIDLAANIPDPLNSDLAKEIYRVTRMDGKKSPVPLYIFNGEQEFWVPAIGAKNLYREQCSLGVKAVYRSVFGEHFIAAFTGYPESLAWLDQRLQGVPAPNEC